MEKYNIEKLLSIHHWCNNLFSFTCTRNKNFKFKNGEFVLIGIEINKNILSRAYSIVSSNYDNYLEFLSIKILNGSLTSKLKNFKINDLILISKKSTGTLIINNLLKGENLWLICTGTGISPFISVIKNFNTYNIFKNIILVHSCRNKFDFAYKYYILNNLFYKNYYIEKFKYKFIYYQISTLINIKNDKRITNNIINNKIFLDLNFKKFNKKFDRIMLCGNNNMLFDISNILNFYNLKESKNEILAHYVIERAFID